MGGNILLPNEGDVITVSSQQQLGKLQRLGILLKHRITLAGFDCFHTDMITHIIEIGLYIVSLCRQQFRIEDLSVHFLLFYTEYQCLFEDAVFRGVDVIDLIFADIIRYVPFGKVLPDVAPHHKPPFDGIV